VSLSLLSLGCASTPRSAPPPVASTPADLAAASNAFGFDLYARVKADPDNLIFSPFSAAVALNMASAGARGPTRTEMLGTLYINLKQAEMLETGNVPPKVFHADHPFLYLIRDRKTGAVLFLGRVAGLGGEWKRFARG